MAVGWGGIQTDRQTDRQTDGQRDGLTRVLNEIIW